MVRLVPAAAATLRMSLALEDDRVIAAKGVVDHGHAMSSQRHIHDVIVAGLERPERRPFGPDLGEVLDVTTLQRHGQLRVRTAAAALGEHRGGHGRG
jgi:hypothetical protein